MKITITVAVTAVAIIIAAAACGGDASNTRAPTVAVPKLVASSSPTPSPPIDPESEWHSSRPTSQAEVFYPVAGPMADRAGCVMAGTVDGNTFLTCGRDLARFAGPKLDVSEFRRAPLPSYGWRPTSIHGTYPSDFWVTLEAPEWELPERGHRDEFTDSVASSVRLHAGTWTPYVFAHSSAQKNARVMLVLPAVKRDAIDLRKPGCEDYACANVLPRFIGIDAAEAPDFGSLAKRIAWIHVPEKRDYAYAVDPSGPVYVFMRALDLVSKRRVFGVARWAPGGQPARFDPLPAPLDNGKDLGWTVASPWDAKAAQGQATFEVEASAAKPGAPGIPWLVRFDGRSWSVTKKPTTISKPEPTFTAAQQVARAATIGGFRFDGAMTLTHQNAKGEWVPLGKDDNDRLSAGVLTELAPSDVVYSSSGFILRTVAPEEVLVLTDAHGFLHPWPDNIDITQDPAGRKIVKGPKCDHPFAVLDVLDEKLYDEFRAAARASNINVERWGRLEAADEHIPIVETRVFGHVVLGASFSTAEEAASFLDGPRWTMSALRGDLYRGGTGVYCVRPIAPKPFVRNGM